MKTCQFLATLVHPFVLLSAKRWDRVKAVVDPLRRWCLTSILLCGPVFSRNSGPAAVRGNPDSTPNFHNYCAFWEVEWDNRRHRRNLRWRSDCVGPTIGPNECVQFKIVLMVTIVMIMVHLFLFINAKYAFIYVYRLSITRRHVHLRNGCIHLHEYTFDNEFCIISSVQLHSATIISVYGHSLALTNFHVHDHPC